MTEVFETAGKEQGLQAWRVENMKLVPNSQALKGNLHTGDSYLILKTIKSEKFARNLLLLLNFYSRK